jgi:hypothetical protein
MSFPLNVRTIDTGMRKEIERFEISIVDEDGKIRLEWTYPEWNGFNFLLFRNQDESGLISYKLLESGAREYEDAFLIEGEYEYAIKAVYDDGGESPMKRSQKVKIGVN